MNGLQTGAKLGRHPTASSPGATESPDLAQLGRRELESETARDSISLHSRFTPT